jgi:hypothetical protein
LLETGDIICQGEYSKLLKENEKFRKMVGAFNL